jgi:hypothetical protein
MSGACVGEVFSMAARNPNRLIAFQHDRHDLTEDPEGGPADSGETFKLPPGRRLTAFGRLYIALHGGRQERNSCRQASTKPAPTLVHRWYPWFHIGGTSPFFPTAIDDAESAPPAASVPITITCAPGTSSAGEPGSKVTTGVSVGTTMVFCPSE